MSAYDLAYRSQQADHVIGSPPAPRVRRWLRSVDGDHVAVVQESVEDGGGEDAIAEHAAPIQLGLTQVTSPVILLRQGGLAASAWLPILEVLSPPRAAGSLTARAQRQKRRP